MYIYFVSYFHNYIVSLVMVVQCLIVTRSRLRSKLIVTYNQRPNWGGGMTGVDPQA